MGYILDRIFWTFTEGPGRDFGMFVTMILFFWLVNWFDGLIEDRKKLRRLMVEKESQERNEARARQRRLEEENLMNEAYVQVGPNVEGLPPDEQINVLWDHLETLKPGEGTMIVHDAVAQDLDDEDTVKRLKVAIRQHTHLPQSSTDLPQRSQASIVLEKLRENRAKDHVPKLRQQQEDSSVSNKSSQDCKPNLRNTSVLLALQKLRQDKANNHTPKLRKPEQTSSGTTPEKPKRFRTPN